MQREEIVNLEKEAARAIQTNAGTFFRRVYADDFAGTLSHGQVVNKTTFISAVQNGEVKYDAFNASDVNVRVFRDAAVATMPVVGARSLSRREICQPDAHHARLHQHAARMARCFGADHASASRRTINLFKSLATIHNLEFDHPKSSYVTVAPPASSRSSPEMLRSRLVHFLQTACAP